MFVRHGSADAIFAESHRHDSEVVKILSYWRIDVAVALQLDDNDVAHLLVASVLRIVELQVEVDGEAFGLCIVHKRDAVEVVHQFCRDISDANVCVFFNKLFTLVYIVPVVDAIDLDSLLVGTSFVILVLNLEEREVAVFVSAHSHLNSVGTSVVMIHIHRIAHSIKVDRAIRAYSLAIQFLHEITVLNHLEQSRKLSSVGNILVVQSVHQLYSRHLFK